MSFARGKYTELARAARAAVVGKCVILIVIDGAAGSDVSMDVTDDAATDGMPTFMLSVARLLNEVAGQLLSDAGDLQAKLFPAVTAAANSVAHELSFSKRVAELMSAHKPACIKNAVTQMWAHQTLEWPCTCKVVS